MCMARINVDVHVQQKQQSQAHFFLSGQHRRESHISEEKMHATPDAAASQCQPVPATAANAFAPHPASPSFAAWTCVARQCIKRRDAVVLAATPSASILHALLSE